MEAVTVPSFVTPPTAILKVVPSLGAISVTAAVIAPAVPPSVTSVPIKDETSIGSLNMTVKLMDVALAVGSA